MSNCWVDCFVLASTEIETVDPDEVHIEKKPLISLQELPDSQLNTYNLTLTNHFKGHFFARPVLLQQSLVQ
jgi:hypothetical protein